MVKESRTRPDFRFPDRERKTFAGLMDESSMDSSVYDISMDDSSSIHSSDYSKSSAEEHIAQTEDTTTLDESLLSRLTDEILGAIKRRRQAELPLQSSTNSTSSSSGSPWIDDDDSSSCSSSSSKPSQFAYKSRIERRQFDEARSRMAAQELAIKSKASKSRRRGQSPSSIRTGMSPSKPIDVTDRNDIDNINAIPISHRILDQVRHARLVKAGKANYKLPNGDLVAVLPSTIPAARIVGLVPEHSVKEARIERREARTPVTPIVLQLAIPTKIHKKEIMDIDNVSSIGGSCAELFPTYHHGRRGDKENVVRDLEHGRRVNNVDTPVHCHAPVTTDYKHSHGWINHRSDLELCLIGLVVSSLATLIVLVAIMIVGKDMLNPQ